MGVTSEEMAHIDAYSDLQTLLHAYRVEAKKEHLRSK